MKELDESVYIKIDMHKPTDSNDPDEVEEMIYKVLEDGRVER